MQLLHVPLAASSQCIFSEFGDFRGKGMSCELLIARPDSLELWCPDDTGKLIRLCAFPSFAVLRSASKMYIQQLGRDCVVLGSDSGYLSIVAYDCAAELWSVVGSAGFGIHGCLKDTPGQYVASSVWDAGEGEGEAPGQVVVAASVEGQMVAYSLHWGDAGHSGCTTATTSTSAGADTAAPAQCKLQLMTMDAPPQNCARSQFSPSPSPATSVVYGLCGVPGEPGAFAVLEASGSSEGICKRVAVYTASGGSFIVTSRRCFEVHPEASALLSSGQSQQLLLLGMGMVQSMHATTGAVQTATLPALAGGEDLLVAGAAHQLKSAESLVLVQGERGALYRVRLPSLSGGEDASGATAELFEQAASRNVYAAASTGDRAANMLCACTSLSISSGGLLFCAAESGVHSLFAITSLGSDAGSADTLQHLQLVDTLSNLSSVPGTAVADSGTGSGIATSRRAGDFFQSAGPVMDLFSRDLLGVQTPQLYSLCGSGNSSNLRISRKGCSTQTLGRIALSNATGASACPKGVWPVASSNTAAAAEGKAGTDQFVVVSFADSTLVLRVDVSCGSVSAHEPSTAEPGDLGCQRMKHVNTAVRTLYCGLLADDALLQVHSNGLTHISRDGQQVSQWEVPAEYTLNRTIEHVSCNGRQLVITLCASSTDAAGVSHIVRGDGGGGNGHDCIYFELDESVGQLIDSGAAHFDGREVASLDLGSLSPDGAASKLLAVGFHDDTIQVLSLDASKPTEYMKQLSNVTFTSCPTSLCFFSPTGATTYLHVGCANGELVRLKVSEDEGGAGAALLSVASQQTLASVLYDGQKADPVRLARVHVRSPMGQLEMAVVASSALTIIITAKGDEVSECLVPVRPLEHYCSLSFQRTGAASATQALVTISCGNTFELLKLGQLSAGQDISTALSTNDRFSHSHVPLHCTPRKMAPVSISQFPNNSNKGFVAVVCAERVPGGVPGAGGKGWTSCLQLVDPEGSGEAAVLDTHLFDAACDEAAFSVCVVDIHSSAGYRSTSKTKSLLLIVGTADALDPATGTGTRYRLHAFTVVHSREQAKWCMQHLHSTALETFPRSLSVFDPSENDKIRATLNNRYKHLVVGGHHKLYVFEVTKTAQLVLKSDFALRPAKQSGSSQEGVQIARIAVSGPRIFVGDSTNSVQCIKYHRALNSFTMFAADRSSPRFVSALTALDSAAVCVGDRFGNIFTLSVADDVDDDISMDAARNDDGFGHIDLLPTADAANAAAAAARDETEVGKKRGRDGKKADGGTKKGSGSADADKVKPRGVSCDYGEMQLESNFYLGESVTALAPANSQLFTGYGMRTCHNHSADPSLVAGEPNSFVSGGGVLLAGTISGSLSLFVPLREELASFFMHLETCIRRSVGAEGKDYTRDCTTSGGLCVRHHQSYRGTFSPVKDTIDGALVLTYRLMRPTQQADVAAALSKLLRSGGGGAAQEAVSPKQVLARIAQVTANAL